MTDFVSNDRPLVANPALRSSKPAIVSAVLALHLDCSRNLHRQAQSRKRDPAAR